MKRNVVNEMVEKAKVFMVIADSTRRENLQLLTKYKELALHELLRHFEISRTAVSKHLMILKAADLVQRKKATYISKRMVSVKQLSNTLVQSNALFRVGQPSVKS